MIQEMLNLATPGIRTYIIRSRGAGTISHMQHHELGRLAHGTAPRTSVPSRTCAGVIDQDQQSLCVVFAQLWPVVIHAKVFVLRQFTW